MFNDDAGLNVLGSGHVCLHIILFVPHFMNLLFMAFRDLFGLLQLWFMLDVLYSKVKLRYLSSTSAFSRLNAVIVKVYNFLIFAV